MNKHLDITKSKYNKTYSLLVDLRKAGYEIITIGDSDPQNNPACESWPTGPYSVWAYHHSFGCTRYNVKKQVCLIDNWPALWRILEKYKLSGGCANGHQYQISPQCGLITGTYSVTNKRNLHKLFVDKLKQDFVDNI